LQPIKETNVVLDYNFDGQNSRVSGNELFTFRGIRLLINNNIMALNGNGLYISDDSGNNWHTHFPYAIVSNIVKDSQGRLFVGLYPDSRHDLELPNNETTGVWFSENNGITD